MSSHRMAYAERVFQTKRLGHHGNIASKIAPGIRRRWFPATAMPTQFDRDAAPPREVADDFIPGASVKSGGMSK